MKKRIFSVLLVFTIFFGMGIASFAEPDRCYPDEKIVKTDLPCLECGYKGYLYMASHYIWINPAMRYSHNKYECYRCGYKFEEQVESKKY